MLSIPETRKACTRCEDMTGEYVQWVYEFFFRIYDQTGDSLDISIGEEAVCLLYLYIKSSADFADSQTVFLGGIQACDLRANLETMKQLEKRLSALLGNLIEVHKGIQRNEEVSPCYGPYWEMAITSWVAPKVGKVVYGLTGCEIAH